MAAPGTCKHVTRESGYEVCPKCDYGTCPRCGITYIKQDSGDVCWQCAMLASYRERVAALERAQEARKAKYLAPAHTVAS